MKLRTLQVCYQRRDLRVLLDAIVTENSHAVIGGNNIGLNEIGVVVSMRSSVQIASPEDAASFSDSFNNSNVGNNAIYGVYCIDGGAIFGAIGTLSGNGANKGIDANTCLDRLF